MWIKNTFVTLLSLLILSTATFAQPRQELGQSPSAAVYVAGIVPDSMKTFLGTRLSTALTNAGADVNDETDAALTAAIGKELSGRSGGAINDSLISELGRKLGLRYICAASITPTSAAFKLSAYIISTKTGKSRYGGEVAEALNTMDDLDRASGMLAEKMFGGKRIFGGQTTPEPNLTASASPETVTPEAAAPSIPQTTVSDPAVYTAETAAAQETKAYEPPTPEPVVTAESTPPAITPTVPDSGKRTVAVYMAGEEPEGAKGVHGIMGGELARVLSESDKYTAVDRTEVILEQLDKEHVYQRSGAVDDDQIKAIGHQLGVGFLCISNINAVGKGYYLDTRLVDVVTAEIIRSVTATSTLKDANEMSTVGRNIALELLEAEKTRRQRQLRKTIFRSTAIGLDVLGAGVLAYGYLENGNVINNKKIVGSDEENRDIIANGPEAYRAATRRNVAYVVGGVLVAAGVTIHILF